MEGGCRHGMCLESTPERRTTNHERSPEETPHEEHGSFLVDCLRHDQETRELSEEARLRSVQKAPDLGHAAECRIEYVGTKKSAEKLLLGYFENELRAPSSAKPLMTNPFARTEGQLLFTWCLAGVSLEDLTWCNKLKLGDKGLHVYRMMTQYVARDDSGLNLVRMKDATCFLRRIISLMPDAAIQARYQKATKNRKLENRVSIIILNVYQNAGIEKDDYSRQSLENHAKIDETRTFSDKQLDSHDGHCAITEAENYCKPSKQGEYHYFSGVMAIS